MEDFNSFEYSTEQKSEGKWLAFKILLLLGYVLFAGAYFVVIFVTRIIPLGALIPVAVWILIFLTWRYTHPDYQYIIETGVFTFYVNYGRMGKRKIRKEKTSFRISEAKHIVPVAEAESFISEFSPVNVYCAVPSKSSTDVYVALYNDKVGKKSAIYFVTTPETLRLLKIYNSAALKK